MHFVLQCGTMVFPSCAPTAFHGHAAQVCWFMLLTCMISFRLSMSFLLLRTAAYSEIVHVCLFLDNGSTAAAEESTFSR